MRTLPNWHLIVPEFPKEPVKCDVWTEEEGPQFESNFQVDKDGFFVHIHTRSSEDQVVEICQISDVRQGVSKDSKCLSNMSPRYCDLYGPEWQKHAFTVCSGSDLVDITYHHFVCIDTHQAEVCRECILRISRNNVMNNLSAWTNLKKQWTRLQISRDQNGKIPVKLISRTFASGKGEKDVNKALQELKLTSSEDPSCAIEPSALTVDLFYQLYMKLCLREDVHDLFKTLADVDSARIDAETFATFLNECQRDLRLNEILFPKRRLQVAKEMIQRFEVDENAKGESQLTLDGFVRFLMSDENSPILLKHLDVYMDMDQPLSHYFINSSHNTYLTGRQFYGKSSVEMYRRVLLAGCRCVELDCWDGEDGEPIITHGKAICTSIPFKDVLYAIRDTAFVTSQYPVILSLENHCSRHQQEKMARYCKEVFEDLLLKEPLADHPLEPGRPLPSPNALKGKILLKNKRLNNEKEDENGAEKEASTEQEPKSPIKELQNNFIFENDGQPGEEENDCSVSEWKCTKDDLEVSDVSVRRANEVPVVEVPQIVHTSSTTNVHPDLSRMVNYAQPIKFAGFKEAQRRNIHHNMSSFSETTALSMLNSKPREFVQYNKRQMSRIYPRGTRLDSTNFMPHYFWAAGCQMLALNFQTPDVAMQINQGKFEYNGNCGYLLKPEPLRSMTSHEDFDVFTYSAIDGVVAAELKVQVLSGQFLSDRRIGTYVEVDLYGLPSDTIRKEFRTKLVYSNGLNPRYEDDPFRFRKVIFPELAVLRFGVYDETNRLLGQRVVPFESLESGYRHIPLRTEGNFPTTLPTLFCRIELSVYVPEYHRGFFDSLTANSTKKKDPKEAELKKEDSSHELDRRSEFRQNKSLSFDADIEGRCSAPSSTGCGSTGCGSTGCGSTSCGSTGCSSPVADDHQSGSSKKRSTWNVSREMSLHFVAEKDYGFPRITVDTLKQNNDQFAKLLQKQDKKLRQQKMKHAKQLEALSRSQCLAAEKLDSSKRKPKSKPEEGVPGIMADQVDTWSRLKEKHREEELKMRENHVMAQFAKLERLMKAAQARQMKQLQHIHKCNTKKINSDQAKTSIKAIEELKSDSTLKSNGEKERCVREKKERMTRMFANERRQIMKTQQREIESLLNQHNEQLKELQNNITLAMEKIKNERKEDQMDPIREFYV